MTNYLIPQSLFVFSIPHILYMAILNSFSYGRHILFKIGTDSTSNIHS